MDSGDPAPPSALTKWARSGNEGASVQNTPARGGGVGPPGFSLSQASAAPNRVMASSALKALAGAYASPAPGKLAPASAAAAAAASSSSYASGGGGASLLADFSPEPQQPGSGGEGGGDLRGAPPTAAAAARPEVFDYGSPERGGAFSLPTTAPSRWASFGSVPLRGRFGR